MEIVVTVLAVAVGAVLVLGSVYFVALAKGMSR